MSRGRRSKAVQGNDKIPYQTLEEPPVPMASERQAEWERVLKLPAGALSPALVKLRKRLCEEQKALAIRADLATHDSQGEV